ncbi:Response regulator [Variovorax sp. PBS-H4]|uniref:helix-turn-helix transcriptional regulator n=1 Tax=Variovorax sp. PBS-H4 TaxID=434008 RepID=UPI00131786C4|nr:LuxR C-terminal-related transcriptional regulator [Variovorax sp. PBS-H4]VTU26109.1 Response regulator [Variovorax sp. PBS-H4]
MRTWTPDPAPTAPHGLAAAVSSLGEPGFGATLLDGLHGLLPLDSVSVYRIGAQPAIFFSASLGVPDTTRDCWRAYLSGPIAGDRTLRAQPPSMQRDTGEALRLCHITAGEVAPEHRAKVYEAHGVVERVSVIQDEADDSLLALNFYRHRHQRALSDTQLAEFGRLGGLLMALARKHIALASPVSNPGMRERLLDLQPALSARELDVCTRILQGMSQEGIAVDLGISLPTVKTYRNRAFARIGIHFRSELFALMLAQPGAPGWPGSAHDQRMRGPGKGSAVL